MTSEEDIRVARENTVFLLALLARKSSLPRIGGQIARFLNAMCLMASKATEKITAATNTAAIVKALKGVISVPVIARRAAIPISD